jgi:hypothetical protein
MWRTTLGLSATVLGAPVMTALGHPARSDEPRLSISGYDPVAYFTDGKPVQGKAEFEYLWHKLRWHFANGEHRAICSSRNRAATRHNTTASARWA